jgi:predicted nucleic acid-binding protein
VRYLIDSNIWLYAAAGKEEAVDFLDVAVAAEWAGYTAISRLELFGYPDLKRGDDEKLKSLLACFTEMEVSTAVIDKAIEVRRRRRVKVPDAIIAATALLMHAKLVTRNVEDFKGIEALEVIDPFADQAQIPYKGR